MLSLEYLLRDLLEDDECCLLYIDDSFLVVDNNNKVVKIDGIVYVEVSVGEEEPALIRLDSIKGFEIMDKIEYVMASVEAMCCI